MSVEIKKITTESINEKTKHIDQMSTLDILKVINEEDQTVPLVVGSVIPQIAKVVDVATPLLEKGGRLIYLGAGTSGRIGLLDASECPPTYGVSKDTIMGMLAGGIEAFSQAKEGAEDSIELAVSDLKKINLSQDDILVGIAASGRTPYVVGGIKYAKELGVKTACIVNAKGSVLAEIVDYPIEAVTGSEVINGSTRMKSGTAQKLICNMLSTTIMIKLGHVYQNLMIDLVASNEKLVARQINILKEALDVSEDEAALLFQKYGTVKNAIFGYLTNIKSAKEVETVLAKHHNNLRKALEEYQK